jgi:hypothetical protein
MLLVLLAILLFLLEGFPLADRQLQGQPPNPIKMHWGCRLPCEKLVVCEVSGKDCFTPPWTDPNGFYGNSMIDCIMTE